MNDQRSQRKFPGDASTRNDARIAEASAREAAYHASREAELDALLNAAFDAEALGDLDAAQHAWAQVASMDEASRRSAAVLASGLAQLREDPQRGASRSSLGSATSSIGERVLQRLNIPMPEVGSASDKPARDAEAIQALVQGEPAQWGDWPLAWDSSSRGDVAPRASGEFSAAQHWAGGRAWGPSARVRRRWYQVSPTFAAFLLGAGVTLGLVAVQQLSDRGSARVGAVPVQDSAQRTHGAPPSKLVRVPSIAGEAADQASEAWPSLRLGDTSRYTTLSSAESGLASLLPARTNTSREDSRLASSGIREGGGSSLQDRTTRRHLGPALASDLSSDPQLRAGLRWWWSSPMAGLDERTTSIDATRRASGDMLWRLMLEEDDVLDQEYRPLHTPRAVPPR